MHQKMPAVVLAAMLVSGCASSQYYDIGMWDAEGVCGAVTETLRDGNYRIETRQIHSPPDPHGFRATFISFDDGGTDRGRCFVKVQPEEKPGRYRADVTVDEKNPCLFGIRQRSERKEEDLLEDLGERLGALAVKNRLKP